MSAARRHKKHHHEEHENHERWLVSGYDMMTLLFAVFVVLFAISSTNVCKVKALQQSLQEAFSGPVLSGGQAMMQTRQPVRGREGLADAAAALDLARPGRRGRDGGTDAKRPPTRRRGAKAAELAAKEEQAFQALKRGSTRSSRTRGLDDKVSTTVSQRGLKVRLLTDELVLRLGQRRDQRRARSRRSTRSAAIIAAGGASTRSQVEGHTDDRPIATSQYPSNWQLSGARAGAVVQRLIGAGVVAEAHVAGRLRRGASRRQQRVTRGTGAEPPGRDHPHPAAWSRPRRMEATCMNKKMIIIVVVALVAAGGAYKTVLAKPKKKPSRSRRSRARSTCSRRSSSSTSPTAASPSCQVALVLEHAAGRGRRPRRPDAARGLRRRAPGGGRPRHHHGRAHGRHRPRPDRPRGPREAQEADPRVDQEAHRRPRRGSPLPRRDRPVARHDHARSRRLRPLRDHDRPRRGRSRPAGAELERLLRRPRRAGRRDRPHAHDHRRDAGASAPGSIVTLNRLAGEPVDLLVNGKPIARGEVVVHRRGVRPARHRGARARLRARRGAAEAPAQAARRPSRLPAATPASPTLRGMWPGGAPGRHRRPRRIGARARRGIAVRARRRRRVLAQGLRGEPHRAWRRWSPTTCCCRSSRSRWSRCSSPAGCSARRSSQASVLADLQRIFPTAAESTLLGRAAPRAAVLDDRRHRRDRRRDLVRLLVLGRAGHRVLPHLPLRVPLLGAPEGLRARHARRRAAVLGRHASIVPTLQALLVSGAQRPAARARRRAAASSTGSRSLIGARASCSRRCAAIYWRCRKARDAVELPSGRARSARRSRWASSTSASRSTWTTSRTLRIGTSCGVRPDRARLVLRARADPARRRRGQRAALRARAGARHRLKTASDAAEYAGSTPIQSRPLGDEASCCHLHAGAAVVLGCLLLAPAALAADGESTPAEPRAARRRPTRRRPPGASGGGLVRTIVGLAIVIGVIYGLYWVLKQVKALPRGARRPAPAWARSPRCRSAPTARCTWCAPAARSCCSASARTASRRSAPTASTRPARSACSPTSRRRRRAAAEAAPSLRRRAERPTEPRPALRRSLDDLRAKTVIK